MKTNEVNKEISYETLLVTFGEGIGRLNTMFDDPQVWGVATLKQWIDGYETTRFTEIDDRTAVITSEYNMDSVKAAKIDGIAPTFETISNGTYPVSRSLYIYVKKANVGVTPGLREFVNAFVSDAATGKGGYLQQRGLIPLSAEDHAAQKTAATDLAAMAPPAK